MKNVLTVMTGIAALGLLLNAAGEGKLGTPLQKLAQQITKGYGV